MRQLSDWAGLAPRYFLPTDAQGLSHQVLRSAIPPDETRTHTTDLRNSMALEWNKRITEYERIIYWLDSWKIPHAWRLARLDFRLLSCSPFFLGLCLIFLISLSGVLDTVYIDSGITFLWRPETDYFKWEKQPIKITMHASMIKLSFELVSQYWLSPSPRLLLGNICLAKLILHVLPREAVLVEPIPLTERRFKNTSIYSNFCWQQQVHSGGFCFVNNMTRYYSPSRYWLQ